MRYMTIAVVRYTISVILLAFTFTMLPACSTATTAPDSRFLGVWQSTDQRYYALDGSVDPSQPTVTLTYEFFEDGTFRRSHTMIHGDVIFRGTFTVSDNRIVFDVRDKEVPEEIQNNLAHITQYENAFLIAADQLTLMTPGDGQFSKIETIYRKIE